MRYKLSWEYLAGFVDGEGHLAIRDYDNRKYKGRNPSHGKRGVITFGQSVKQNKVMFLISDFLRGHGIQHCFYTSHREGGCSMTLISIGHKKHMAAFLNKTIGSMIVKREIAEKLMKFCKGELS